MHLLNLAPDFFNIYKFHVTSQIILYLINFPRYNFFLTLI